VNQSASFTTAWLSVSRQLCPYYDTAWRFGDPSALSPSQSSWCCKYPIVGAKFNWKRKKRIWDSFIAISNNISTIVGTYFISNVFCIQLQKNQHAASDILDSLG
jgi:hypothetical protein